MMSRMAPSDRQGFACAALPRIGQAARGVPVQLYFYVKGLVPVACQMTGRRGLVARHWPGNGAVSVVFPFILRAKKVMSPLIKTQIRGFAVCVKRPFFLSQLPLSPWLAASKTRIRQPITPQCGLLVVQPQVRLLPMQPAAAKPKVRLLARLSVACRAAYQACLLATDTNTGLTAAQQRSIAILSRPFGDAPRMAFLHFRACGVHPRKGCHV